MASSACPSRPHAAAATLLRRRCRQQEELSRPRLSNPAAHLLEHVVYLAAHAIEPLLHPALRAGERGCTKGEGSAEGQQRVFATHAHRIRNRLRQHDSAAWPFPSATRLVCRTARQSVCTQPPTQAAAHPPAAPRCCQSSGWPTRSTAWRPPLRGRGQQTTQWYQQEPRRAVA